MDLEWDLSFFERHLAVLFRSMRRHAEILLLYVKI